MNGRIRTPSTEDAELSLVATTVKRADPDGQRFARAFRRTFDMILDRENTGRYRWDQLHKTEKNYFGNLAEINVQRELGFADGQATEFSICGIDVACKYAHTETAWPIPPEVHEPGHLLLGLWANDTEALWSVALLRPHSKALTPADHHQARHLTAAGKKEITWLFRPTLLPENFPLRP